VAQLGDRRSDRSECYRVACCAVSQREARRPSAGLQRAAGDVSERGVYYAAQGNLISASPGKVVNFEQKILLILPA
jgi:hypothetical protein